MKTSLLLAMSSFVVLSLVVVPITNAQDEQGAEGNDPAQEQEKAKEDLVLRPGVIASKGVINGAGSTDYAVETGMTGDKASSVQAGIVESGGKCRLSLKNISEKNSFSLSYEVIGKDDKGRVIFKRPQSSSLKPKESTTSSFSCGSGLNYQVLLKSGQGSPAKK